MARGGARVRSGPAVDPNSARSDARGIVFASLPPNGYKGEIPEFPIPVSKGSRVLKLWEQTWRCPQGAAWIGEPWRWHVVAEYCLLMREVEQDPSRASVVAQLHRYRDQLGLTPAGLKENGWRIGGEEVKKPSSKRQSSSRDRVLKAVAE